MYLLTIIFDLVYACCIHSCRWLYAPISCSPGSEPLALGFNYTEDAGAAAEVSYTRQLPCTHVMLPPMSASSVRTHTSSAVLPTTWPRKRAKATSNNCIHIRLLLLVYLLVGPRCAPVSSQSPSRFFRSKIRSQPYSNNKTRVALPLHLRLRLHPVVSSSDQ